MRKSSLLLLIALIGCSQPIKPTNVASPVQPATGTALTPEITKALATAYKIAPLDLLDIHVYMEPDLSKTIRVSPNGTINYPLIGETEAAGLSPFELEKKLAEKLKTYVINPNVSVDMKELHSRRVAILGEVAKPGLYDIPGDKGLSVVEAIATAGGFTKFASPNATRIVRTIDGKQSNINVPVNDITKGQIDKDVQLKPDDVVFVPQTMF